jgi:YaiO family outer membrane protein
MTRSLKYIATILLTVMANQVLFSQDWKQYGVDELFGIARQEAFDRNNKGAREKLAHILLAHPDYDEVRVFLGTTYAWDGQYEQARQELQNVLHRSPANIDALTALINVELWSLHYDDALSLISSALDVTPRDQELLYKKSLALNSAGKSDEALLVLNELLTINESHTEAIALQAAIRTSKLRYTGGLQYTADAYSKRFDPAQGISAQLTRLNSWGSSTFRLNYLQRFSHNGVQFETDLYPKFSKSFYGFVNYGYSSARLFPHHRIGIEGFGKVGKKFESSAGVRYMQFTDNDVFIYTASASLYVKQYWFSLRPYLTRDRTSASAVFSIRRYFQNAENYIGFSAGLGYSPDFTRLQTAYGLTENNFHLLNSRRTALTFQKEFRHRWIFNGSFEVVQQALNAEQTENMMIFSSNVGIRRRF